MYDNTSTRGDGSRRGKHRPDKMVFNAFITAETKTLLMLTGEALNLTYTDILLEGLNILATKAGVLVNGQVSPAVRKNYDLMLAMVKEKLQKGNEAK